MKICLCLLCIPVLTALSLPPLFGQNREAAQPIAPPPVRLSPADELAKLKTDENPAIPVIRRALTALGGDAWKGAGAATAQISTSYSGSKLPPQISTRSDDWSGEKVRGRQELQRADGNKSISVGSETSHLARTADGKAFTTPVLSDMSDLVQLYPAAALELALRRDECSLNLLHTDEKLSIVREICFTPRLRRGVYFTWWFDASGLPTKVEFPLATSNGRFDSSRIAVFRAFQQVGDLTVAKDVEIQVQNRPLSTLSVSGVTFQVNLPEKTFSIQ